MASEGGPKPKPMRREKLGARASSTGGYWEWPRDERGGCPSKAGAMTVLDSISGQEGKLVRAQFHRLLTSAERGRLRFGRGKDVDRMVTKPHLLELRVQVNPHAPVDKRHLLRLYFSEPDAWPRLMLALRLAPKPRGGDKDGSQDRDIREANRIYEMGEPRNWGLNLRK